MIQGDLNSEILSLLDNAALEALLGHYESVQTDFKQKMQPLQEGYDKAAKAIQILKARLQNADSTTAVVQQTLVVPAAVFEGTRIDVSVRILRLAKRIMTPREIVEFQQKNRPGWLTYNKDLQTEVNSTSATLGPKADKKLLIQRAKTDTGDYWYGLPEWFDEDGKPKKEYNPLGIKFIDN